MFQHQWPTRGHELEYSMMTSSNGNIFRVTGPLCGEFTGPGEFPTQRPVTRSFDVFFDLRLNKRLSKQLLGWWFETQSWSLWRHPNGGQKWRVFTMVFIQNRSCHQGQAISSQHILSLFCTSLVLRLTHLVYCQNSSERCVQYNAIVLHIHQIPIYPRIHAVQRHIRRYFNGCCHR